MKDRKKHNRDKTEILDFVQEIQKRERQFVNSLKKSYVFGLMS